MAAAVSFGLALSVFTMARSLFVDPSVKQVPTDVSFVVLR